MHPFFHSSPFSPFFSGQLFLCCLLEGGVWRMGPFLPNCIFEGFFSLVHSSLKIHLFYKALQINSAYFIFFTQSKLGILEKGRRFWKNTFHLYIILALASVGALVTFRRNRRFFVLLKRNVDKVGEACEWKETRTWSICYIFRILKLCSFDS